jgi:hypothetical protein
VKCGKCPRILVKIKYCSFTRKPPSEDVDAFDLLARKMRQVRFTYVLKLIVGFLVIVVVHLSFFTGKKLISCSDLSGLQKIENFVLVYKLNFILFQI